MSWDFGVGDFITLLEKANDLRKRFINAPSQFQSITDDVKNLSNIIRDIDDYDPDLSLDLEKKTSLNYTSRNCRQLLDELDRYLDKFQDLNPQHKSTGLRSSTIRVWKRVRWDQQDIDVFRTRIAASISALNLVVAGLNSQLTSETRALVKDTREEVGRLVRHQDQQMIQNILEWLSPINITTKQADVFHDCQKGTGQWFLETHTFQQWIQQYSGTPRHERNLFCPGIPGAGKTLLASTVIDQLCTHFQYEVGAGVAFFYCNFREQVTLESILGCLLKQLARQLPVFPEVIEDLYTLHQEQKTRPALEEIIEAFDMTCFKFNKTFLIIDALDECHMAHGSRDVLLDEVFELQTRHTLGLLATSRDNPDIADRFTGSPSLRIRANQSDIEKYLRGQMDTLPRFVQGRPELQQQIVDKITEAVDGMFLLARLHLDSLKGKISPKQLRNSLLKLSTGLDAAYKEAINRIEAQTADQSRAAKEVLAWIICATRPLTPIELQHALAIESHESYLDEDNIPEINDLVSICAGLVTIDEQSTVIRLAHYTTQEYLEQNLDTLFPGAHSLLGSCCLTYLSFKAFESDYIASDDQSQDPLETHPLYSYCALNMGHHVKLGAVSLDPVLAFLRDSKKVFTYALVLLDECERSLTSTWLEINGLHLAVYLGLYEAAKALIREGYEVSGADSQGRTGLSWLAEMGSSQGVRFLLAEGADPDSMDINGQTALSFAALAGHEDVFHLLGDAGGSLELKNSHGRTPLFYAIWGGHEGMVKLLLDENVDADCKDFNGQTPLFHAIQHVFEGRPRGSRIRIIDILLSAGVDANCCDKTGQHPLSYAVQNGNNEVVKALLAAGCDIECKNQRGETALLSAVTRGYEEMVKILIESGADTECKNHNGQTPLSSSASVGHETMVRILLDGGADVNSRDEHFGKTALSYAAWNGFASVVDLLLQYGADPTCMDNQGRTALSWAAEYGRVSIVRTLLKRCGDSALDEDLCHRTPVAWASLRGHQTVVDVFSEAGYSTEEVSSQGSVLKAPPADIVEISEGLPKSFTIEE